MTKLICISDTHTFHRRLVLPEGDILIHAGDCSFRGKEEEIADFGNWFANLSYKHKILVWGNHDFLGEDNPTFAKSLIELNNTAHVLQNSGIELDGLKFWGSADQPWFHNWAFNRNDDFLRLHWKAEMPNDIDVLITHCPPFGIKDEVLDISGAMKNVGCKYLRDRVIEVKPKCHIFGHIHEGYGFSKENGTTFINACTVDAHYKNIRQSLIYNI